MSVKGGHDHRAPRRWSTDTLAMLLTIDVLAFAAAAWLALSVPEAFDSASAYANAAGRMFADNQSTFHQRHRLPPDASTVEPPTF
ncbi:MAG TPA: hypothetical protein VD867_17730 [Burkholderiales bacterium]|nr:hypothetical protein [Burkholderiales bacterium]